MQRLIVPSPAEGPILVFSEGLSFWGGVDPTNGRVIDAHHPECGRSLAGKIVVMPTSRGSCSGSGVLLELVMNDRGPAAFIFREHEDILTLGALIATRIFGYRMAVARLPTAEYDLLATKPAAKLEGNRLLAENMSLTLQEPSNANLELSETDLADLNGEHIPAATLAMETLCTMASLQSAKKLLDVICQKTELRERSSKLSCRQLTMTRFGPCSAGWRDGYLLTACSVHRGGIARLAENGGGQADPDLPGITLGERL